MKLLQLVSGADRGGAKNHVLFLLPELQKTENVRLVCLGDGPLARDAAAGGLPPVVLRGGFFTQLTALSRLLEAERPDLLHCHGTRADLAGALTRRRDVCLVSTVHSDHTLDYLGRPAAGAVLTRLNGWALRRMDALFCVSDAMTETYRRRGYKTAQPIYNGLDFSEPPRPKTSCAETVTVGTAARLDPVKDLPTLLRGFALAAKTDARLRLRIAGAGGEEQKLRALAGRLGVSELVEFCGWVGDMEGFYASLDIAALTSRSETFPYALLMAARQALPAAAADVGGVSALVEDGTGGYLFRPGDAEALARALERLSADGEARIVMGQALRRRAEAFFTLDRTVRTQRELYRLALRRKKQERQR